MYNNLLGGGWVRLSSNLKLSLMALTGFGGIVFSAGAATPANTLIQNSATVSFSFDGVPGVVTSNVNSFYVDEVLQFSIVADNPAGVFAQSPQTNAVISYTLTNSGNG